MQSLHNKPRLFELLAQGATVLTPNNRLSEALLQQYFQQAQIKTLDKPHCLPYNSAIIKAYQQAQLLKPNIEHPKLINNAQCQQLWRQLIQASPLITYTEGLLNSVMDAWKNCLLWQINSTNPLFQYTSQTQQFQNWWQKLELQLDQKNLISEQQLVPHLLKIKAPLFTSSVVWVCFDDFNPQQISLQQKLSDQNVTQYRYDLNHEWSEPRVLSAKDSKEEEQQLFAWLQQQLDYGKKNIAVVVPELQQVSRSLRRKLLKHFDPSVFNISLGSPLAKFPIIAHALNWLSLDCKQLSNHQAMLLLQTPYIGHSKKEFNARSQYLQDSSLLQNQVIPLQTLISDLNPICPQLAALLTTLQAYPKEASPHDWVELLQKRLNSLGFPGDYGLNSENYQCFNRLNILFDEFRQFGLINDSLTSADALELFKSLCNNTIFQAQKTNALIQISGLLEASGCEFESLWVMGLTDQCLPQKPRLSAFIPPQLQRDLFMPHCLPERELLFAKQTLLRLQNGSHETVFSYPQLQGDSPNLACSLIAKHPTFEPYNLETPLTDSSELITHEENYLLPPKEHETISGGSAILANQAKCPFKAFAAHRLNAQDSLETAEGLDPRERGKIIHKILELVWQSLNDQHTLLQIKETELDLLLDKTIQAALNPYEQLHPTSFTQLIQEVEWTRLKRLVHTYLQWEKERPPFSVIAVEQSYTIELSGLEIKLRVDRLDQVDEAKWVIDYKTSLPASKPWYEDRPLEPQLLLYALLDEEINALLFMQLKSGNIVCSGISEEKQTVSGLQTLKKTDDQNHSWSNTRTHWQQQLTLLADEFQQGYCPPQPDKLSLCMQCDFQNLCRFQASE